MLSVGAAEIFTVEVGSGPPVVMLHGGPGASHDYLRPQMDRLTEAGVRLFYYDQRGSGKSPLPAGLPYAGYEEHVQDLEKIRLFLGREKMALLGYSWGGLLAVLYALQYAERVERMALVSPAPMQAVEAHALPGELAGRNQSAAVQALKENLDRRDPGEQKKARFMLAVAGYFFDPMNVLQLTPFLIKERAQRAVWDSLGNYDLRERLQRLSLPVLVIHGKEDLIPIQTARDTAKRLRAPIIELPRCGHVPYIEAPDETFAALLPFFRG